MHIVKSPQKQAFSQSVPDSLPMDNRLWSAGNALPEVSESEKTGTRGNP